MHSASALPNAEPSSRLVYTILPPQIELDQLAAVTVDVWDRLSSKGGMRWDLVIERSMSTVVGPRRMGEGGRAC